MTEGKQLQHDPTHLGGPCRRCGLKYTAKTAYVPCFEEGDIFGTWLARMSAEVREVAVPAIAVRMERSFYNAWAKMAREAGASEDQINAHVSVSIIDMMALFQGNCPKCGAPATRYFDPKTQRGASDVPGVWAMYRCSTQPPPGERRPEGVCDFMLDLKE